MLWGFWGKEERAGEEENDFQSSFPSFKEERHIQQWSNGGGWRCGGGGTRHKEPETDTTEEEYDSVQDSFKDSAYRQSSCVCHVLLYLLCLLHLLLQTIIIQNDIKINHYCIWILRNFWYFSYIILFHLKGLSSSSQRFLLNSLMWSCHRLYLHYFLFTENSTEGGKCRWYDFLCFHAEFTQFNNSMVGKILHQWYLQCNFLSHQLN